MKTYTITSVLAIQPATKEQIEKLRSYQNFTDNASTTFKFKNVSQHLVTVVLNKLEKGELIQFKFL